MADWQLELRIAEFQNPGQYLLFIFPSSGSQHKICNPQFAIRNSNWQSAIGNRQLLGGDLTGIEYGSFLNRCAGLTIVGPPRLDSFEVFFNPRQDFIHRM